MANQDITINAVFFGIRRRYLAWRWKYAVPIEMNVDGEIGGYFDHKPFFFKSAAANLKVVKIGDEVMDRWGQSM